MPYQRETPLHFKRYILWRLQHSRLNGYYLRRGERGFYLIFALVLFLAVLAGAGYAINRAFGGNLGALFSAETRQAEEAAEAGIQELVGSFNAQPNRRLIVTNLSPSQWGSPPSNKSIENPCKYSYESGGYKTTNSYVDNNNIPFKTSPVFTSGNYQTVSSDSRGQMQYYLERIVKRSKFNPSTGKWGQYSEFTHVNNTWSIAAEAPLTNYTSTPPVFPPNHESAINLEGLNNNGSIIFVVKGRLVRGGKIVATSTLTREFEIIPKCCDRSVGRVFVASASPMVNGRDTRTCSAKSGLGDLGFVVAGNNDGQLYRSGNSQSLTLLDPSGNPLPNLLDLNPNSQCLLPSNLLTSQQSQECNISTTSSGSSSTTVLPSNAELPDQPALPKDGSTTIPTNQGCIETNVVLPRDGLVSGAFPSSGQNFSSTGACTTSNPNAYMVTAVTQPKKCNGYTYNSSQNAFQIKKGAVTETIPYASVYWSSGLNKTPNPLSCYTIAQGIQTFAPYCVLTANPIGILEYYCRIKYVNYSGTSSLKVDTTSYPVNLIFYDSPGSITLGGSSYIDHVVCTELPSSPGYETSCTSATASSKSMAMFGNIPDAKVDLRGNGTNTLYGLFDFRYADVTLNGGGTSPVNFGGILWSNNTYLNGGVTVQVPPSGSDSCDPGTICAILSEEFNINNDTPVSPPFWDYVIRGIRKASRY